MVKTGAIFKNFIFDGVNSADYGVYITGAAVYNAPVRDVDFIEIPGRNGAFALDNGRFANITVTYPAGMYGVNETDFATAISDLRNALASRKGYCRLTDEYNPNEYRMAVYKSGLEVTPAQLKAGEFNIVFDCKPQRFLTSGETEQTITNGATITNPALFDARPLLKFKSTGTDGVINLGSQKITILSAYIGETPLKLSVQETTAAGYVFADVLTIQNTSTYKTGDAITFTGASVTLGYGRGDGILTIELSNNNGISGTATHNGGNFSLNLSATEANFTAGTSATITKTISATVTPRVGTAETKTITFTATYNGSDTITIKWATQTFTGYPLSQNRTANTSNYSGVVNSTINSLANVDIYIDLDIGEAYSIDASNNAVSLNNFVNLGGELPILPPGATTITYGNSIQNLKITPRWWRV